MCQGCYVDEYGNPTVEDLPENAEQIVDLIRELYGLDGCSMGGPLHVQIEDLNIEDTFFDQPWWERNPTERDRYETPKEAYAVAKKIFVLMKPLTIKQRAAVVGSFEGWI